MSPPTEQLIRDYLNRLSVAARGQLGPDDRRALVSRTRDFIERKTGLAGPSSAIEVARLLSGLGDPAVLVQQERRRLAAIHGEMPEPAAGRNPITRALRRGSAKPRGASWHWPAVTGSRTDLQLNLLDSGSGAGAQANAAAPHSGAQQSTAEQSGTQQPRTRQSGAQQPASSGAARRWGGANGTSAGGAPGERRPGAPGGRGSNGTAASGSASDAGLVAADESAPRVPAQSGDPDWFFRALSGDPDEASESAELPAAPLDDGQGQDSAPSGRARPAWPLAVVVGASPGSQEVADNDEPETSAPAPTSASPVWQLTTPSDPVLARQVRRALTAVTAWYRRRPLEASAVVLLGLGGAIYPPVWLLGAVVALPSRVWDGRDKWLGLTLPVLLTVIAVALGVTSGGHVSVGHGMHEGWVYGVIGSRVAAVLSASYLCWRSVHGRRPPAVPPWNRPHKVS